MRYWIFIFFALTLFISSCDNDEVNPDLEFEVASVMESQGIPSVTAGIVNNGQLVWTRAFGHADISSQTPATTQSLYTLQSVSKLILSVTVMQLWENGRVDLEGDINQYLPFEVRNPGYPDVPIRVYHLLNHTSGLAWPEEKDRIPAFSNFYFMENPPVINDWLPEYILPGGSSYREAVWKDFEPGSRELYSNIGTSLLALVVEEISGQDYRDYCQMNVFDPLGMSSTAFRFENLDHEELVTPYSHIRNPMFPFSSRHYPVGWVFTNVEDFSKFMICILNKGQLGGQRILEEPTVERMHELQNPITGCANLWWHMMGDVIGHKGGGRGYSSWAEWHMEDGSGFFLFSNIETPQIWPKGRIYELVRYQSYQF